MRISEEISGTYERKTAGVPHVTIQDIRDAPDLPPPEGYDDGRHPAYGLEFDDPALHEGVVDE